MKPSAVHICAALAALASVPAGADPLRPLSTDRPDMTESPYTVPPGHLQLEWGVLTRSLTHVGSNDIETRSHTGFNLKIGIHPIVDLEVIADPRITVAADVTYFSVYDTSSGPPVVVPHRGREEFSYLGPTIVRLKFNAMGEDDASPVALALIPFWTVHSGDLNASVHGLAIPAVLQAGDRWSVGGMVQGSIFSEELVALMTAVVSVAIAPTLDAFVEVAGERVATSPSPWVTLVNAGTAWRPFANLQLDGAFGFGILESASDWTATLGLSVRR